MALTLSGVEPPIGVRLSQLQVPIVDKVTASPVAGLVLLTETSCVGGWGPPMRYANGSVAVLVVMVGAGAVTFNVAVRLLGAAPGALKVTVQD